MMSDEGTLALAKAGSQEALCTLLRRYGPHVRHALRGRIPARWRGVLSIDDVMQVTYLNAMLGLHEFASDDGTALAVWLTRIARNNLRNALRALSTIKRGNRCRRLVAASAPGDTSILLESLVGPGSTPSHGARRREVHDTIARALRELPEAYERVLRLYDLDGHNASETADLMGRSVGAIYMLRARALERLREKLGTASGLLSAWG